MVGSFRSSVCYLMLAAALALLSSTSVVGISPVYYNNTEQSFIEHAQIVAFTATVSVQHKDDGLRAVLYCNLEADQYFSITDTNAWFQNFSFCINDLGHNLMGHIDWQPAPMSIDWIPADTMMQSVPPHVTPRAQTAAGDMLSSLNNLDGSYNPGYTYFAQYAYSAEYTSSNYLLILGDEDDGTFGLTLQAWTIYSPFTAQPDNVLWSHYNNQDSIVYTSYQTTQNDYAWDRGGVRARVQTLVTQQVLSDNSLQLY